MKRLSSVTLAVLVGALGACERKASSARGPLAVTVAPVVQKDVTVTQTWVGLLDGYQNADIRAQVTGYLIAQNYKEGTFVKSGTVLFTIDKRPFEAALAQAQADLAEALAKSQLAQITLQRQTQLYQTKVISQQEYDTSALDTRAAIAAAAAAQANVDQAQINLNYCTITAPLDGIVGTAQAQIGDLVGPGGTESVLTQLSQVDPMKAVFSITEQQYLRAAALLDELSARAPDKIHSVIELRLADGTVYSEKGKFDFVDRQINVATGTIQVTGLFPNANSVLRPGLFARVTAPTEMLKDALLVPQESLVELQGTYQVAVVQPDDTISIRRVKVGPTDGDLVVVTGQLAAGENVVVAGVEKVRPGMKVAPSPAASPTPSRSPEKSPQA